MSPKLLLAIVLALPLLCLAGIGVDRILLWMEDSGWIHYRRTRLNFEGARGAMIQIGAFLEPAQQHVVELRERMKDERQEDDEGGRGNRPARRIGSIRDDVDRR